MKHTSLFIIAISAGLFVYRCQGTEDTANLFFVVDRQDKEYDTSGIMVREKNDVSFESFYQFKGEKDEVTEVRILPSEDDWRKQIANSSGDCWSQKPRYIEELNAIIYHGPKLYSDNEHSFEEQIRALKQFTSLKVLDLRFCPVDDDNIKNIEGMKLTTIDLSCTAISDDTIAFIADNITVVKKLVVRDTNISSLGIRKLAGMELTSLSIAGTKVADDDLKWFFGIETIVDFRVHNTDLTDDCLGYINSMPNIETLELSKTKIVKLERLNGMRKLKVLYVEDTQVSDESFNQLYDLPSLELIYCRGSKITDAGIATLKKRFPKLRIVGTETGTDRTDPIIDKFRQARPGRDHNW